MIILTNKAGPSSGPSMLLLLVSISTVFGCGVIPGGQTSIRTFTASGPSNLPVIAVYTDNNLIPTQIPGIATSKDAVQAFVQRFAMQTVIDVLEIEGRRALLPDFVISSILDQIQVNTTYELLLCKKFLPPELPQDMNVMSCIIVGSTVTGMCPAKPGNPKMKCQEVGTGVDGKHLSLSGTLTQHRSEVSAKNSLIRLSRSDKIPSPGIHVLGALKLMPMNVLAFIGPTHIHSGTWLVDFLSNTDDVAGVDHKRVSHELLTTNSEKPAGRFY
ncbi:hypothetical protein KIN20_004318 [Parelaphostrongylus tenuis]|uniref:Uncharacterized protein n=1 Tax=Parelaphostrongylus tenuis TaxID=148309 RepID=A0AAD5QHY7_PARTN|nr:hypothetical protein KIN20_004318 [Parelaphostrongylus tenuis]